VPALLLALEMLLALALTLALALALALCTIPTHDAIFARHVVGAANGSDGASQGEETSR